MKATIYIAVAVLLSAAATADAQTLFKDGEFGDTITGDIHWVDESDVIVARALKGSKLKINLGPAKKSPYRAVMAIYEEGQDVVSLSVTGIATKGGNGFKTLEPLVLPSTGRYRIRVLTRTAPGGAAYAGDYLLKTKIIPQKKFEDVLPFPESGEADVTFVALAGSTANIVLKAGPGSELPVLVDILRPNGESVLTSGARKDKKKAITVKKVALPDFGEYRVRLTGVPFKSCQYTVSVKNAKRKAQKVDVRDYTPPERPILELSRTAERDPLVLFREEEGGADRYIFLPGRNSPLEYVVDRPAGLSLATIDQVIEQNRIVGYTRTDGVGEWEAIVADMLLEQSRLVSYRVSVVTPTGNGTSVFSGIQRDLSNKITNYSEVRTYGEEGVDPAHSLRIYGIERPDRQTEIRYKVDLEGPEGPLGTFVYPPWSLPES